VSLVVVHVSQGSAVSTNLVEWDQSHLRSDKLDKAPPLVYSMSVIQHP
jgi:hypothetical protein